MGKPNSHKDDGFTLVELLVVVFIIGLLAAIAIPVYLSVGDRSKATVQNAQSAQDDAITQLTTGDLGDLNSSADNVGSLSQVASLIAVGDSQQVCSDGDLITLSHPTADHVSIEVSLQGC